MCVGVCVCVLECHCALHPRVTADTVYKRYMCVYVFTGGFCQVLRGKTRQEGRVALASLVTCLRLGNWCRGAAYPGRRVYTALLTPSSVSQSPLTTVSIHLHHLLTSFQDVTAV